MYIFRKTQVMFQDMFTLDSEESKQNLLQDISYLTGSKFFSFFKCKTLFRRNMTCQKFEDRVAHFPLRANQDRVTLLHSFLGPTCVPVDCNFLPRASN